MRPFIPLLLVAALTPAVANARFFSTAAPEDFIQVGIRAGLNTSTQTIDRDLFPNWSSSGWGTGFHAGVEVPLGIFDFLSIQPGFFYQLRSGDYAVSSTSQTAQMGHYSMSYISIPVTVQINFNINERLRWSVEAGPYFSWRFGSHHSSAVVKPEGYNIATPDGDVAINPPTIDYPVGTLAKQKKDFGLKIGTFFLFDRHWYAGLHYYGGMTRVYKDKNLGGSNLQWSLTLGYNF